MFIFSGCFLRCRRIARVAVNPLMRIAPGSEETLSSLKSIGVNPQIYEQGHRGYLS
jgi:hypothetical protein